MQVIKKLFKFLFINIILIFTLNTNVFAETVSFKVILDPSTTKVGNAVDITIKAIDENGDIDKDYTGTIGIIEGTNTNEGEVEFPGFSDSSYPSYTFKASDEGVKKFENSIKFLKAGEKGINVGVESSNDDTDGPIGEALITVEGGSTMEGDISITYPNSNETIGSNTIKVTGQTKPNYRVKLKINDSKTVITTANDAGFYQQELKDLPDETNVIVAYLLDGDENIIGESNPVSFNISTLPPSTQSFEISPETDIKPGDSINVTVYANPDMDVNIYVDDVVYALNQEMEGKYIGNFAAPDSGTYPIDLEIIDDLGIKNFTKAVKTFTVKGDEKKIVKKEEVKKEEVVKEEIIKEEPFVQTGTCEETKITGLKLTELKTKSILSWPKIDGAVGYKVYKKIGEEFNLIENIDINQYTVFIKDADEITYEDFAIKSICKVNGKEIESKEYSDITKIQTGPKEVILFILFSMLISGLYFIFFRKKQS